MRILLSCLVTVFCVFFSTTVNAETTLWEEKKNVSIGKSWVIEFNEDLDISTVNNQTVYIQDESEKNFESIVTLLDSNKVEITPIVHGYLPKSKYTLIIKDVKSNEGEHLDTIIKMPFEIESWYLGELSYSEFSTLKSMVNKKINEVKLKYPVSYLSDYEYEKSFLKLKKREDALRTRVAQLANVGDYEGKKELQLAQKELAETVSEIEDMIVSRKAQIIVRSYENVLIEYRFWYERENNHSIVEKNIIEIERSLPVGSYSEYEYTKKSKELMQELSTAQNKLNLYSNASNYYEQKMKKQYQDEVDELKESLDVLNQKWSAQLRIDNLKSLKN